MVSGWPVTHAYYTEGLSGLDLGNVVGRPLLSYPSEPDEETEMPTLDYNDQIEQEDYEDCE